ncbi:MAG TPA: WYL domain-containing protein [Gemmatimonadaceae bacterium]|nr:WYL domain-containing protein [Gemmatimonadaceae bacterium]
MTHFEDIIREAGREQRRVLIQFECTPGGRCYERELEPYAIQDGRLIAFSYLRNEFRTLALDEIRRVEVTPRSFQPRRPVDL